jgi:aerobic C4-dicarboxylate transport protein
MQGTVEFARDHPEHRDRRFRQGRDPQVLLFSVMFGFALHKFGGRGTSSST